MTIVHASAKHGLKRRSKNLKETPKIWPSYDLTRSLLQVIEPLRTSSLTVSCYSFHAKIPHCQTTRSDKRHMFVAKWCQRPLLLKQQNLQWSQYHLESRNLTAQLLSHLFQGNGLHMRVVQGQTVVKGIWKHVHNSKDTCETRTWAEFLVMCSGNPTIRFDKLSPRFFERNSPCPNQLESTGIPMVRVTIGPCNLENLEEKITDLATMTSKSWELPLRYFSAKLPRAQGSNIICSSDETQWNSLASGKIYPGPNMFQQKPHDTHLLVCSTRNHWLRKNSFQKLRRHHYTTCSWRIKPANLQMKASSTAYKCRVPSLPSVKVCPLVGIDALGEHTPHEGNRMVLIVTFSVSQNRIARKFYTEFRLQEVTTCQNSDLSQMQIYNGVHLDTIPKEALQVPVSSSFPVLNVAKPTGTVQHVSLKQ